MPRAAAPGEAASRPAAVTEQVTLAAHAAAGAAEAVQNKGDSDVREAGDGLQASLDGRPQQPRSDDAVQAPADAPDSPSPRLPEPARRPRWRRVAAAVPYVTLGLAAANVAAYHSEAWAIPRYFHGDLNNLLRALAFSPTSPWFTTLTSMLVHDGPNHLGHNVSNILFFGSTLELLAGRRAAMLAIYLAAGVATPLLLLTGLAQPALLYGASGALFGLMGALVGSLWRAPESPWDILAWVPGVLALNAFGVECLQWLHPADLHVSHLSHVVGFLVGLALARKMLKSRA